jgi:hypothetical protein
MLNRVIHSVRDHAEARKRIRGYAELRLQQPRGMSVPVPAYVLRLERRVDAVRLLLLCYELHRG